MAKSKMCPLLTAANMIGEEPRPLDDTYHHIKCDHKYCQWWDGKRCIFAVQLNPLVGINESLSKIAEALEGKEAGGGEAP